MSGSRANVADVERVTAHADGRRTRVAVRSGERPRVSSIT
jgi:hypothetical protein